MDNSEKLTWTTPMLQRSNLEATNSGVNVAFDGNSQQFPPTPGPTTPSGS